MAGLAPAISFCVAWLDGLSNGKAVMAGVGYRKARKLIPALQTSLTLYPSLVHEDASSQTVCFSGRGTAAPEVCANDRGPSGLSGFSPPRAG
jgi:hypothetical protein